jgi:signal transduction histidine kinase/CheY-like chemotaxis protein
MAGFPHALRLISGLLLAVVCFAQTPMTLGEVSRRKAPDLTPVHEGRRIVVEGVVPSRSIRMQNISHLLIQDEDGRAGLTIQGQAEQFASIDPGSYVEVTGVVAHRAGLPILKVEDIRILRAALRPVPRRLSIHELAVPENLGLYVEAEGRVLGSGRNTGGDILSIGRRGRSIIVFIPRDTLPQVEAPQNLKPGATVRVTGFSSQYAPTPPHNYGYQVVARSWGSVMVSDGSWVIPTNQVLFGIVVALILTAFWWLRDRTLLRQRSVMRRMTVLSEEIIAASTPGEIARKLENVLPALLGASTVECYIHDRGANTLDRISPDGSPKGGSVKTHTPIGGWTGAVALCFRNRALLHIPDTRRSPLIAKQVPDMPRSASFIPMFAQGEILGVVAVRYRGGIRRVNPDQQAALQHLGNQIATSLKLQQQQSIREQLLRTEKMAAAGQLISSVANELRGPMQTIRALADKALDSTPSPALETELREIAYEASRGGEIINHLLSFTRTETGEPRILDINALVNRLREIRDRDWALKGIHAEVTIPLLPVYVMADQSQIEQTILNLLLYCEHQLSDSTEKTLRVGSRVIGKRVLICFEYSRKDDDCGDPFGADSAESFGPRVCQAIIQSHGGDIRYVAGSPNSLCRFDIELPVQQAPVPESEEESIPTRRTVRTLTVLVVEPDAATQRRLMVLLNGRGHRVILVGSAEQAAELVQRVYFDVTFCAMRLPGLNWVEFFQRVRNRVGGFVLLTEGYDAESAREFKSGDGYILRKPLQERDLDDLLGAMDLKPAGHRR